MTTMSVTSPVEAGVPEIMPVVLLMLKPSLAVDWSDQV